MPANGTDGVDHEPQFDFSTSVSELAKAAQADAPDWAEVLFEHGRRLYKNHDFAAARDYLTFVEEVAGADPDGDGREMSQDIAEGAQVLLDQVDAGLDFFGHMPGYAPRLEHEAFRQHAERVIRKVESASQYALAVASAEGNAEQRVANLRNLAVAQTEAVADAVAEIDEIEASRARFAKEISEYEEVAEFLETELDRIEDIRERIVETSVGNPFRFGDLIGGLGRVVAGVTAISSGGGAVFVAQNAPHLAMIAAGAGGTARFFVNDSDTIADEIAELQVSNAIRSVTMELFRVKHAISLKLWRQESHERRADRLAADVARWRERSIRLESAASQATLSAADFARTIGVSQRVVGSLTEMAHRSLYLAARALEFASLRAVESAQTYPSSPARLREEIEDLVEEELNHRESIAGTNRLRQSRKYTLVDDTNPEQLNRFRQSGRFTFRLTRREHFNSWERNVRLEKIQVTIEGATTDDGHLTVLCRNGGESVFYDQSSEARTYFHQPFQVVRRYRISDGTETSYAVDREEQSLISPLADWMIRVPEEVNANRGLNLDETVAIRVQLKFRYDPEI
jgi:hypothetical protein